MILTYLIKPLEFKNLTCYVFLADVQEGHPIGRDKYPYQPENLLKYPPDSISVTPADRRILMSLIMNKSIGGKEPVFYGSVAHNLVMNMVGTGRCYFWPGGPPLVPGTELAVSPVWVGPDDDGNCRTGFDLGEETVVLPTTPLLALEKSWVCRQLNCGLPDELACSWRRADSMTSSAAKLFLERRAGEYPGTTLPVPPHIEEKKVADYKPVPQLTISRHDRQSGNTGFLISLVMRYGSRDIPLSALGEMVRFVENNQLITVTRARTIENAALQRLKLFGLVDYKPSEVDLFAVGEQTIKLTLPPDSSRTLGEFTGELLPQLESEGWQVRYDTDCRLVATSSDDWYADFAATAQGWLAFESGVRVGDKKVNLLPFINRFLAERRDWPEQRILDALAVKDIPVPADDCILLVPGERLLAMVRQLFELYGEQALDSKARLIINELRAAEIAGDLKGTNWRPSPALVKLVKSLRGKIVLKPKKAPRGIRAVLRSYQEYGLSWLCFLEKHQLGGILADDMGLGKTIQALALLQNAKNNRRLNQPALIVAPTSVLPNWRSELRRFAPGLRFKLMHGADRHLHWNSISKVDVVLTSYALVHRDALFYGKHKFSFVILDEAQFIKNAKAKTTQSIRLIKGRLRLCMTGTPVENHLGELWSLMQFALPGLLGTDTTFKRVFRDPIERHGNPVIRDMLTRRIKPLLLRRTKSAVEGDLPPKSEIVQTIPLSDVQLDLYQTVRIAMTERVRLEMNAKGLARSRIIVLDALLKLREICCDPRLRDIKRGYKIPGDSGKLAWLTEVLPEMAEEGRRILVFSQFTRMLDLIKQQLVLLKLPYVEIRGSTRDRETPVRKFQVGKTPVFLISLKAGGTGLNLTAADTVVHYDPWWNPAVESQAADRAHRIGQKRPVFVYKLVAEGTVEERILDLQKRKRMLAEVVNGSSGAGLRFSKEDIDQLLAPVGS